jgi:hypothetical protein
MTEKLALAARLEYDHAQRRVAHVISQGVAGEVADAVGVKPHAEEFP